MMQPAFGSAVEAFRGTSAATKLAGSTQATGVEL